jgi:hypothetical protein
MKNLLILAFFATTIFISCTKEEAQSTDEMETLMADNATADNLFSDEYLLQDEALAGAENLNFPPSPCLTVTHDTTVTPRLITLDYGSVNCRCRDGRFRRGIVLITYTGRPNQPGSVMTINHSNYFVNDHQISGIRTFTNGTYPGTSNPARMRTANITISFPRGGSMNRVETDTVEFFAGFNTPNVRLDDVFLIRGMSSGSQGSFTFNRVINTPLRREVSCQWLTSGNVTISRSGRPSRTIDYGNGTCDNQAIVTVNGTTRTITLP